MCELEPKSLRDWHWLLWIEIRIFSGAFAEKCDDQWTALLLTSHKINLNLFAFYILAPLHVARQWNVNSNWKRTKLKSNIFGEPFFRCSEAISKKKRNIVTRLDETRHDTTSQRKTRLCHISLHATSDFDINTRERNLIKNCYDDTKLNRHLI